MKKKALSLVLALVICLLPTTALAGGNKSLAVGETLTLNASGSYDPYTEKYGWEIGDESIVTGQMEGAHHERLVLTGVRPGTTKVTMRYNKLEWDSGKTDIWGNVVGDYVIRYKTDSWTITVTGDGTASVPVSSGPVPGRIVGTVGENVKDSISNIQSFGSVVPLMPVKRGDLWGYADVDFRLVIPFQFDDADSFDNSKYAVVKIGEYRYVIDGNGEYVVSKGHTDARSGHWGVAVTNSYIITFGNDGTCYDPNGIEISYDEYERGVEAAAEENVFFRKRVDSGGNWMYAKIGNQDPNPAIIMSLTPPDGDVQAYYHFREGLQVISRDGMYGAIDKTGKIVVPCVYDKLCASYGGYLSYRKDGTFGLLENPVNPPSWEVPKQDPEVENIPASGTAYAAGQTVRVDGIPVKFYTYVLRDAGGGDTNYVRLRDVAYVLSGTGAQFEVKWDGKTRVTTSRPYTAVGGEMTAIFTGDQIYRGGAVNVQIDGRTVPLTAIVLTDAGGGGNTYFKLRDLGAALGFDVAWSAGEGITIHTK